MEQAAGGIVQQDESLLEIATDKVDSEVPSTTAGVLKEILFPENAVVPVGAVIAKIESEVLDSTSDNSEYSAPFSDGTSENEYNDRRSFSYKEHTEEPVAGSHSLLYGEPHSSSMNRQQCMEMNNREQWLTTVN